MSDEKPWWETEEISDEERAVWLQRQILFGGQSSSEYLVPLKEDSEAARVYNERIRKQNQEAIENAGSWNRMRRLPDGTWEPVE